MDERFVFASEFRIARCVAVALAATVALPGCFVANTVKSEFSSYAEPTGENLAHIRLIGSRNVKVYPNSTCARLDVPGGGYPAGPQWGGQRKRDLGMPKLPDTPKHFVEIAARPDQPIATTFSFYAERHRAPIAGISGMPGSKTSSGCSVTASLVPEVNANYEVRALWGGSRCVVLVSRLMEMDGQVRRVPVAPSADTTCAAPIANAEPAAGSS